MASWTEPRDWTDGEVVTAQQMNEMSNNLRFLHERTVGGGYHNVVFSGGVAAPRVTGPRDATTAVLLHANLNFPITVGGGPVELRMECSVEGMVFALFYQLGIAAPVALDDFLIPRQFRSEDDSRRSGVSPVVHKHQLIYDGVATQMLAIAAGTYDFQLLGAISTTSAESGGSLFHEFDIYSVRLRELPYSA